LRDAPFELEYEGSNDSYTTPPVAPLEVVGSPVAADEEITPAPCCASPIVPPIPMAPAALTPVSKGEETVCPMSGLKLKKHRIIKPAHCMSTAIKPCQFHPYHYHLNVESNLHRGFHRAARDLDGYESSSESGIEGLSCNTEQGDGRHSTARGLAVDGSGIAED